MNIKSNNIILALISSLLSIILVYFSSKGEENKMSYLYYIKHFSGTFVITFLILFLKENIFNKTDISKTNISGGGYQEHLSLGEPGF